MSGLRALRTVVGIAMRAAGAIQLILMAVGAVLWAIGEAMSDALAPLSPPVWLLLLVGTVQGLAYFGVGGWIRRTRATATRAPLIASMAVTGIGVVADLMLWRADANGASAIVGTLFTAALFVCSALALRAQPSPAADEAALEPAG